MISSPCFTSIQACNFMIEFHLILNIVAWYHGMVAIQMCGIGRAFNLHNYKQINVV